MDKMLEEFEEFATGKAWLERMGDGSYKSRDTRKLWEFWQAAVASVVVDIESLPSASYTDDGVVYRSHVEDALEKAGIKCK